MNQYLHGAGFYILESWEYPCFDIIQIKTPLNPLEFYVAHPIVQHQTDIRMYPMG